MLLTSLNFNQNQFFLNVFLNEAQNYKQKNRTLVDTMHFHRQFCVDPTDGFWFISQTWVLDQIFSSVQRIAIKILTKYHCGIMLLKEQQYGRLPDKFWPQVIVDSCSGREIVQNIARQTLTTDYHGFMLPREQQYRTLPDKFWPQIAAD